MAKSIFAILLITLIIPSLAFAECATSTIPGHYQNRYIDNFDGTISDTMTNLMWMKCDIDTPWDPTKGACQDNSQTAGVGQGRIKYTWSEALLKAQEVNQTGSIGRFDWRLPNIKELSSILAVHCISLSNTIALNTDYFNGTPAFYWSSTPNRNVINTANNAIPINYAWRVGFKSQTNIGALPEQINQTLNVRLVRNAP